MIEHKKNDSSCILNQEDSACLLLGMNPADFKELKQMTVGFVCLSAASRLNPVFKFDRARKLAANNKRLEKIDLVNDMQAKLERDVRNGALIPDKIVAGKPAIYPLSKELSIRMRRLDKLYFYPDTLKDWQISKGHEIHDKLVSFTEILEPITEKQKPLAKSVVEIDVGKSKKRVTKLNGWLRDKWEECDKPCAKDFAAKLKWLQGSINCPVKKYHGWYKQVVVEWEPGWGSTDGSWGARAFENKVSKFRREDREPALTNVCQ